ncbi:MAG: DUF6687 family protein [Acidimicrobiales bacterium]
MSAPDSHGSRPPRGAVPLGYAAYEALEERPHVMVDGAARRSSVVTLSHWPQSPTPQVLARDLSVEIALEYVRLATGRSSSGRRARPQVLGLLAAGRQAEAVTNDHFDEDGVMSVLALVDPEFSLAHERLLCDAASCGDFGVVTSDIGANIAFAIGPLAEQEAGAGAGTSERYLAVLPRVRDLVEHPEQYEALWHEEMQVFLAGRAAIERGDVLITDDVADLAIVRRGDTAGPGSSEASAGATRLIGASGGLPIHAASVHSATPASRVLAFDGPRCELYLRYEGWVRYVSRPVPLRPDLEPLAAELTSLEPGQVTWEANPVGAIVGRLRPSSDGLTELAPELIAERVRAYLLDAPAAWDPFQPGGAYVTERRERRDERTTRPSGRRKGAGKRPKRGGAR